MPKYLASPLRVSATVIALTGLFAGACSSGGSASRDAVAPDSGVDKPETVDAYQPGTITADVAGLDRAALGNPDVSVADAAIPDSPLPTSDGAPDTLKADALEPDALRADVLEPDAAPTCGNGQLDRSMRSAMVLLSVKEPRFSFWKHWNLPNSAALTYWRKSLHTAPAATLITSLPQPKAVRARSGL